MGHLQAAPITLAILSLGMQGTSRLLMGLAALMFLIAAWVDQRDRRDG